MALGLCVQRRAALCVNNMPGTLRGTVRAPPCRYCAAVPGKASGISSICVRGCRGREGLPHMRIPLRVARHLRRGELLGGAII